MSKRKKQTQPEAVSTDFPRPALLIKPVPAVALLIDGENVVAPDLIAHILVEAGRMGGVVVRHVYGNWSSSSMQSWKKQLVHYGLEPMGNHPGRNATDIALVIGAMDLFYSGIKHFCLVAGDSDYVPLVQRLRQEECTVLVIGTSAVSSALKNASSAFLSTDQLVPHTSPTSSSPVPPVWLSAQEQDLPTLLVGAYRMAVQQHESEWVSLAALGTALRQHAPAFEAIHGKKRLSTLVERYPECFEVRTKEVGKGQIQEVRIQQPSQL